MEERERVMKWRRERIMKDGENEEEEGRNRGERERVSNYGLVEECRLSLVLW